MSEPDVARVRCYAEGECYLDSDPTYSVTGDDIGALLRAAAEQWAATYCNEGNCRVDDAPINVCVEPANDAACALPGWRKPETDDPYERPFRLFVVRATVIVTWSANETLS